MMPSRLICMQVFRIVKVDRVLTWRFWAVRILPVGFFMALTLHFGNVVYLYLTVAFIQMLKVAAASCAGPSPLLMLTHALVLCPEVCRVCCEGVVALIGAPAAIRQRYF